MEDEIRDVQCLICRDWFLLSDPKVYEVDDGVDGHTPFFGICKQCWIKVADNTSWLNHFREKLEIPIHQYVKVNIPAKLRWKVWEKDNFTCQICESRQDLTTDHIRPEIDGGSLELDNLQTLCRSCNSQKGIRSEMDF